MPGIQVVLEKSDGRLWSSGTAVMAPSMATFEAFAGELNGPLALDYTLWMAFAEWVFGAKRRRQSGPGHSRCRRLPALPWSAGTSGAVAADILTGYGMAAGARSGGLERDMQGPAHDIVSGWSPEQTSTERSNSFG